MIIGRKKINSLQSRFWLGNDTFDVGDEIREGGINNRDTAIKAIKLNKYKKSIENFVKILTGKDIMVHFCGTDSFTDYKTITISADINIKNFDVAVGLAMHEAAHCIHTTHDEKTEGSVIREMMAILGAQSHQIQHVLEKHFKTVINIIEDRRIDRIIYDNAPGYRGYYEKLYQYYFMTDAMNKYARSKVCLQENVMQEYCNRLTVIVNPNLNLNALPHLKEIYEIIDIEHIDRLKNYFDTIGLAYTVFEIIVKSVKDNEINKQAQLQMPDVSEQNSDSITMTEQEINSEKNPTPDTKISAADISKIQRDITVANNIVCNNTDGSVKKRVTKSLKRDLVMVEKTNADLVPIKLEEGTFAETVFYKTVPLNTINECCIINEGTHSIPSIFRSNTCPSVRLLIPFVKKGLSQGSQLGKMLKVHNETNTLINTRQRRGNLDKRLLHSVTFNEDVFSTKVTEYCKDVDIHISLDGSGSMGGEKWQKAIQMTVAICKACSMTEHIHVVVSMRWSSHIIEQYIIYDSAKHKASNIEMLFSYISPRGSTPEGFAFAALIKEKYIVPSTLKTDSYFINFSDGQPNDIKCFGNKHMFVDVVEFAHKQVEVIRSMGIEVLSFFISSSTVNDSVIAIFKGIYGNDAVVVSPNDLPKLARELNKMFIKKIIA